MKAVKGTGLSIHLPELNEIKEWLDLPCVMTFTNSHAGYRIISLTNTVTLRAPGVIGHMYDASHFEELETVRMLSRSCLI